MIKLRGVIQVMGPHGTGKTEFALQAGDLTKTCLLDDDIKGRSTWQEVNEKLKSSGKKFGYYVDIIEELKGTFVFHDRYHRLKELVDKLDEFEVIIVDTWSLWSKACRDYAKFHPDEFRKAMPNRSGQPMYRSTNSQIMQGEISQDGRELEAVFINTLRAKCDTLFLVTHLKPYYHNNINTGKEVPDANKILDRVCQFRIWIRQNPKSAVPVGLVLKRPALREIGDDGRMKTVNFLPQKLTPTEEDESLWDVIQRYADNPMGNRAPTEDETPSPQEMSILEGTLTDEQKLIYQYGVRLAVNGKRGSSNEEKEESATNDSMIAAIREKKSQGMAPPMILEALKSQYSDLTIPMIIGVN